MQDEIYKIIFSKNLKYYMSVHGKTQNDIIRELGVNKSAISTWCNGTRLPRMDKVDLLAKYFGVKRSDLIEDKADREAGASPASLSTDESRLLNGYRSLNSDGREKVQEYVLDLAENERYREDAEKAAGVESA